MQKQIIYPIIFLLTISLVSAIYGGETYTKQIDSCNNLTILIQANQTIENNEFIINKECREIDDGNKWIQYLCNCSGHWQFNLTTKINTINFYNITFINNYTEEDKPIVDSDSSGGSGGSSGINMLCKPWSQCINKTTYRTCTKGTYLYNQSKSCFNSTNVTINLNTSNVININDSSLQTQNIQQSPEVITTPSSNNSTGSAAINLFDKLKTYWIYFAIVGVIILIGISIWIYKYYFEDYYD